MLPITPADYYGRTVTQKEWQELPEEVQVLAQPLASVNKRGSRFFCQRCGEEMRHRLPVGAYYCRACILFGRLRSDENYYAFPQQTFPAQPALVWQGELTPFQAEVSQQLLKAQEKKADILVHAVTGAGKTEMIYPLLAQVLEQGGAVAVVSPRIDVCRELYPRLKRDFSSAIALLHSGSEPYSRSPLVVATVHQLYRFYQAFDLIVIDEVDAFPFVDNDSLYHAVARALKPDGSKVFLTATSTDKLERMVQRGELKQVHLARRFHANPLVVPQAVWLSGLLTKMSKGRLPKKLLLALQQQAQTGYPLLIFFPHIELGQRFREILATYLPEESIGFVSSQTTDRLEVVEAFRQRKTRILVTTTILERGVTFPKVDVFVLWSNHKLYTKSSLVQIAGRVGRSADRPTGELVFFHDGLTRAIQRSIADIKETNQKGGFT